MDNVLMIRESQVLGSHWERSRANQTKDSWELENTATPEQMEGGN